MKAAYKDEEFKSEFDFQIVSSFYKDYFQPELLHSQLCLFNTEFQHFNKSSRAPIIIDLIEYFSTFTNAQKILLSQVVLAIKLLLIMPAKTATSERSFSAVKLCQQRLNNLMVLHVRKELTDSIKLEYIANEFVGDSHHKVKVIGKF